MSELRRSGIENIYEFIRQLIEYCDLGKNAELSKEGKCAFSFIGPFLISVTLVSNLML